MSLDDRVVYTDNGLPAIFFPAGKPEHGGTCSFATDDCLRECPSMLNVNEAEERVLKIFQEDSVDTIVKHILGDIAFINKRDGYDNSMLYWHPWGDCLSGLEQKEYEIMLILSDNFITQYGFTRNRKLWNTVPCRDNLRIGLSVDTEREAIGISKRGLVCWPDFSRGEARLFFGGRFLGRCSDWWCNLEEEEITDCYCEGCFKNGRGCFHRNSPVGTGHLGHDIHLDN